MGLPPPPPCVYRQIFLVRAMILSGPELGQMPTNLFICNASDGLNISVQRVCTPA